MQSRGVAAWALVGLAVWLALVCAARAQAAVYYVAGSDPASSDGADGLAPENQGSGHAPWRTIGMALSVLGPGDTAQVRAGTYHESGLNFTNGGQSEGTITLMAYPGEEPVIDGSGAGGGANGITIQPGQNHLRIQGLTIANMPGSGIATLEQTEQAYVDISIENCKLRNNGWSGLEMAAVQDFKVTGCHSYSNGFYGLNFLPSKDGTISPSRGLVADSSFYDHTGAQGHGLAINQGHDMEVVNCTAYHNYIHGFDVSDWPKGGELSHDILFDRNRAWDNGVSGFSINSDSHHVIYQRNLAWGNGAAWAGRGTSSGFFCYEGCWHVTWRNNTSVGNSDAGFFIEAGAGTYVEPGDRELIFINNLTWSNGMPAWDERMGLVVEGDDWQVTTQNNNWGGIDGGDAPVLSLKETVYTASQINAGALPGGNRSLDPLFMDSSAQDWRLAQGSPLIDQGQDVGLEYCGSAPDIGALERCSDQ